MNRCLTDQEKKRIIALLQAGKPLPAEYRSLLFDDDHIATDHEIPSHILQSILNRCPGIIYIYDIVTCCNVYSNDGVERVLGYSAAEIKNMGGNLIRMLMHPDDYENYQKTILPRYTETPHGVSILHQYRMKNKAGEWRWLSSDETIFKRLPDGSPCQILGIICDITERKAIEDDLDNYREFMNAIPGFGFAKDMNLTYVSANRTFCDLLKIPYNEICGKTDYDIFPPDLAKKYIDDDKRVMESGEAIVVEEVTFNSNTNERFVVATRKNPWFDENGNVIGVYGMGFDITELKNAQEREQELLDKLARAERMQSLGMLAGGVAHDLNNILGPIVMLPEMIDETLQNISTVTDEDVASARECLTIIENSALRAADVIKDLKSLGQRNNLEFIPLDASLLIHDSLDTNDIKALFKDRQQIKLDSKLEQNNLYISGDRTYLHRIILNLISNAADAISGPGDIEIEAKHISLTERKLGYEPIEAGDYVVIHVRDTGEGITDDLLKQVLEPFATTKKTKAGRSGSGLGLSVVNSIIKDHGGYIDIERNITKWTTTFSIYFPALTDGIQENVSEEKDGALPKGTENVLIVDDEHNQRFIAKRCLEELGYTVTEAANGREAIELFKTKHNSGESGVSFDLIILDMIMEQGFDGLDTYNEILKHCPNQKVLIVTGQAESVRIEAAKDLGAAWLSKPYERKDLAVAVRKKLDT